MTFILFIMNSLQAPEQEIAQMELNATLDTAVSEA